MDLVGFGDLACFDIEILQAMWTLHKDLVVIYIDDLTGYMDLCWLCGLYMRTQRRPCRVCGHVL